MTEDNVRLEIARSEEERCKALTLGDLSSLQLLLADDLVHIHGNGHWDGKMAYLEGVANKFRWHRIDRGELKMRIYGDVVVVTGTLSQGISVRGVDKINEIDCFVTQTWIRAEDGWKQSTCHMAYLSLNGRSLL